MGFKDSRSHPVGWVVNPPFSDGGCRHDSLHPPANSTHPTILLEIVGWVKERSDEPTTHRHRNDGFRQTSTHPTICILRLPISLRAPYDARHGRLPA